MRRKKLLFLVHRFPYPPNKGDKIRSFNLLKHLARDYRIYLGTFIDDPADRKYVPVLDDLCEEVCALAIQPRVRKVRSLTGLITGEALSVSYYRHDKLRVWVGETLRRERIERAVVYSSPMAQYVLGARRAGMHRVVDFVDVDSQKWEQYAPRHRWPVQWLYRREADKLLRFERKVAGECEASVFVTDLEAKLFRRLGPESVPRVTHIGNGVDTAYFSPSENHGNPYAPHDRVLVFTGAMDYWANVDAVTWFARKVFGAIRSQCPLARFYIVGARPSAAVRALASIDGVHVTGAVKDIRPYLVHAVAAVAPLRIARGVQNKVLEAMAMAKPVLATPAAVEGIRFGPELHRWVGDDKTTLGRLAIDLLEADDTSRIGTLGRELVLRDHAWTRNLARFESLLEADGSAAGGESVGAAGRDCAGEAAVPGVAS